jgi:hypothetical protein
MVINNECPARFAGTDFFNLKTAVASLKNYASAQITLYFDPVF